MAKTSNDAVLLAIDDISRRRGVMPSLRELGREVGLSSVSAIDRRVRLLEDEGLVARPVRKCARALRVTQAGQRKLVVLRYGN